MHDRSGRTSQVVTADGTRPVRLAGQVVGVLLPAGAADHYVPLHMLGDQMLTLPTARSVSARVFTEAEHAQNHCRIGNQGLALKVIFDWLGQAGGRTADPAAR